MLAECLLNQGSSGGREVWDFKGKKWTLTDDDIDLAVLHWSKKVTSDLKEALNIAKRANNVFAPPNCSWVLEPRHPAFVANIL
eukprot:2822280-Rhodomonas_salina.1